MQDTDLLVSRHPATLRLLVEDKLRAAIGAGRFKPGQRLVERELCELIGVGRTSIREALRQLEAEGLVTVIAHRGPVVSTITAKEAKELYAVRALLEGYAGRQFAALRPAEEIGRLEQTFERFVHAAESGGSGELIEAKTAFYATLMRGCGNAVVTQMLTTLHNRITLLRLTSMTQPGRLTESVAEIRKICEAIRAGDCDRAEEACVAHIERAAEVAVGVLERSEGRHADTQNKASGD
jgi:DNA-binding GntR family transcriptional regulator